MGSQVIEDFRITPHFSFYELTKTSNAALQINNRDTARSFLGPLKSLAESLEVIRADIGHAIEVHSGFRSPALNSETAGSSMKSQHMRGEAADISDPGPDTKESVDRLFYAIECVLVNRKLPFGQLIQESAKRDYGRVYWVHFSLGAPWRDKARCGEVLTMLDGKYTLLRKIPQEG